MMIVYYEGGGELMKFPFYSMPREEIVHVEVTTSGSIPGNGLAICPRCQRELKGLDYIWRCKGNHAYSGPLTLNK